MAQAARPFIALLLLWLAGIAMRLTILAVPPVIRLIHDDLHLSETQVGILSGIPMVLFAGAAIAGSLLIARFGALATMTAGLVLCAAGSALRSAGPSVAILFAATTVMAFGVAVMQPSMPPLVRAWRPDRIGLATAVYTNGLIIGGIVPTATTIPLLLPAIGNSWQWALVIWSLPVAVIAVLVILFAPRPAAVTSSTATPRRKWLPDFRSSLLWRLGLLLGCVNATYFSLNGFLPDYLTHIGRPDLIHGAITAVNLGQLPASLFLLLFADRMVRTIWSYLTFGIINLLAILAIVFLGGVWVVIGAAVWGCFGAAVLILVLALPPLISRPEDVHRLSAGVFTISYSCAVIVPIVAGVLWDATGWPLAPFIPIGVCAVTLIGLAPTVALREKSA